MQIKGGGLIVVIFLLGTALVMAFSGKDEASTDVVEAVANTHSSHKQLVTSEREQTLSDTSFDLSSIKRKSPKPSKNSELFQSKSWFTPPSPQQISSFLPPPPSAPQLSFTFTGRMIDGNEVILFLSKNGRQYTVKVGDVMDDTYRVDKITNMNAILIYLPMNMQQTLTFNSTAIGSPSANEPHTNITM